MIRLRHFLHPVRSARSLYRRSCASFLKWTADRRYGEIPRGRRDTCWCGGRLTDLAAHPSYGVCSDCSCYVNRVPPLPEALREVYSLDNYWRVRQKMKGYPTIERRAELYRSDGRLQYWLSLVERYGAANGTVVEVGCSPGVLLSELKRQGYDCIGVEADEAVAEWITEHISVPVRAGLFPGVDLPRCDMFLAFDVAEHAHDPLAFWSEISRLLRPGGVAILQTPVERRDYQNPFKERQDFFDDMEHLFLYTETSVERLTASAGLRLDSLQDAMGTLGQICVCSKSPSQAGRGREQ